MRTIRISLIFAAMALCSMPSIAEFVGWLKDDVQALMPYEKFPTVDQAMSLIPKNDPLVQIKRSEVLYMLINLESFFPIDEPGKWDDLEKTYKNAFKQRGFRWPLTKKEKALLSEQGFSAYDLVMKAYFPEAYKLKPSADGSHKAQATFVTIIRTAAILLAGIIVLILIRIFRRG